jgi:hypothetical protein
MEFKVRYLNYLAVLSACALLFGVCALAAAKNEHSVNIYDSVKIGNTQLKPGTYKVEWQGNGPAVNVEFLKNGRPVATLPATLRTDDKDVIQDDVVTRTTATKANALEEIDFAHQKEALLFIKSSTAKRSM